MQKQKRWRWATLATLFWTVDVLFPAVNEQKASQKAKEMALGVLSVLYEYLIPHTLLVGEAVALADISAVCALLLLFTQVLDPSMRQKSLNVTRWFSTCVHQPQFHVALGDVSLCKTAALGNVKATQVSCEGILKDPR
ncbi:hypothetical protein GJAV_G00059820 [Gymnothorax javanicus]|nr:hypothetical protein GJAV_G00059820 [Gymnothorax javanicus]